MDDHTELQACRVCLKTSCRLFHIRTLGLDDTYTKLSGSPLDLGPLPLVACAVCALQLCKARQLAATSSYANTLLINLHEQKKKITIQDIKKIHYNSNFEVPKYETVHLTPNFCNDLILEDETEQLDFFDEVVKEESSSDGDHATEKGSYYYSNRGATLAKPEKFIKTVKNENLNGVESDIDDDDDSKSDVPLDKLRKARPFIINDIYLKLENPIDNLNVQDEIKVVAIENCKNLEKEDEDTAKRKTQKTLRSRRGNEKLEKDVNAKKTGTKKKQEKELSKSNVKIVNENFKVQKLSLEERKLELEKVKLKANYIKSPYKCDTCYKGFKVEATYTAHMLKHTESGGQHECPVCHIRFKSRSNYWSHARSHESLYMCNQCPFRTQHKWTALHHFKWHRGTVYKCDLCPGVTFDFETSLARHCRLYHPSPFSCVFCGRGCRDANGLSMHYQWKHAGQPIPEVGPRCEGCNLTFANEAALAKHQSSQHDIDSASNKRPRGTGADELETFSCEECGKSFRLRYKFNSHMRKAHGRGPPPPLSTAEKRAQKLAMRKQCHVCGKFFSCAAVLRDHMDVHTESASHPCPDCGKSFKTIARMKLHRSTHRGQYACQVCQKIFNSPGNRDRHRNNVHKTEKDIECSFCSKGFKSKQERRAHETYVHLKKPWPTRVRDRKRAMSPSTEASLKERKSF